MASLGAPVLAIRADSRSISANALAADGMLADQGGLRRNLAATRLNNAGVHIRVLARTLPLCWGSVWRRSIHAVDHEDFHFCRFRL